MSATILINIPHGTAVQAQPENSTWHKVKYAGYIGYMQSQFLSNTNPGNGGTLPGVIGNGPNSTISAQVIRNGNGKWISDTKTTHPQIKQMQSMLNEVVHKYGGEDVGTLDVDGIYGPNTQFMVNAFRGLHIVGLGNGVMDKAALTELERLSGKTIN